MSENDFMNDEFNVDFMSDEASDGFGADDFGDDGADAAPSRGLAGSAKSKGNQAIRKLSKGRLSFSDDDDSAGTSSEAQLMSVVSESTPGAAMELLRRNERFAFPDLHAYVMLVLPTTAPPFGGLSSRSRGEDKGTLINLINADDIHAVVTNELLDENALGLVPDADSLARMKEFSILTGAEYLYAIACEDVETGTVKVFPVPAAQEVSATERKLFGQVQAISCGDLPLSSAVDERVVAAMLAIYRDDSLADSEAGEALDRAIKANNDLLIDQMATGRYPVAQEVVANLSRKFPSAGIVAGPATGRHAQQIENVVPSGAGAVSAAEAFGGTGADAGDEVEADPIDDEQDLAQDQVQIIDEEPAGEEPDFEDDSAAEDSDDTSGPSFEDESASVGSVDTAALTRRISETMAAELRSIRDEIIEGIGGPRTLGGVPMSAPSANPEVEVAPGSDFSYEQVTASTQRRYINSELGLFVDPYAFTSRIRGEAPVVEIPKLEATPWLGDQAQVLLAALNAQVKSHHDSTLNRLYSKYQTLADLAAGDANREFDPNIDKDSVWGRTYAALMADREALEDSTIEARTKAENAVRSLWQAREDQYVNDAAAKARHEFVRRSEGRIETDLRAAGAKVIEDNEAICDNEMRRFNELRRTGAREKMDRSITAILSELVEEHNAAMAEEQEMVNGIAATLRDYLDSHREEDLRLAGVEERKLAADRRLEELSQITRRQIEEIQQDTANRVELMNEDLRRQEAGHQRQLSIVEQTSSLRVNNAAEQTAGLARQLEGQQQHYESVLGNEARIADQNQRAADAKIAHLQHELAEAREKAESSGNRQLMLLAALIVLVGIGVVVGVSLLV